MLTSVTQDINWSNTLVNHFDHNGFSFGPSSLKAQRANLRATGLARYCLFDFDLAMIFPPDTPLDTFRLESSHALCGAPEYHPMDVEQGEPYYNPFAYDVGCLGNLLASELDVSSPPCFLSGIFLMVSFSM